jgi:4-hydroxy-tetrahydrodipicolinate reductase
MKAVFEMKIFLTGASGNVGRTIVRSIGERAGFELVGGWCLEAGRDLGELAGLPPIGIVASKELKEGIISSGADMIIDFSSSAVLKDNLRLYSELGMDAAVGATGLTEDEILAFERKVRERGLRWAVIPNYCIGVAFLRKMVEKLSPYYSYINVTDRHPARMANAPSGTAVSLARAAKGARGEIESRETHDSVLGYDEAGVKVQSVRMPFPGPYAEHEVTLGRKDEVITINIRNFSSEVYMDGVFRTARFLKNAPAGTFIREVPADVS